MVLTQWETLCGLFFAFFEKIVVPILTSGGCEDYISAESLVECIHGLPVKSIEFFTAENQRKEA